MKTGHAFHKDSFGFLNTALTGAGKWTDRIIRGSAITAPHIAKTDVFAYKTQINHDKVLETNLDSFHIHILPIGAISGGEVIAINYAWAWLTPSDTFPNTLPNTGTATIELIAGDQYKYLIRGIVSNIQFPANEGYSSQFFIQCTRRNDAQDTYPGEFALLDGDVHYQSNRIGSYNEYTD